MRRDRRRRPRVRTASGPADYALFVDRLLCGVVEAKPAGTTLCGFFRAGGPLHRRCARVPCRADRQVRFEYVASDTETLFRDLADPEPLPPRLCLPPARDPARWLTEADTLRAASGDAASRHRWPARLPDRGHDGLEARSPPTAARADPDGHGRGQDLHRLHPRYRLLAHAGSGASCSWSTAQSRQPDAQRISAYRPPGTGRCFPNSTACRSSARPASTRIARSSSRPSSGSIRC